MRVPVQTSKAAASVCKQLPFTLVAGCRDAGADARELHDRDATMGCLEWNVTPSSSQKREVAELRGRHC